MYRRDLITAEIKKLAQVLARIMGLKTEGKITEAAKEFDEALEHHFSFTPEVAGSYPEDFNKWLQEQDFPHEMLDSLADFLYQQLDLIEDKAAQVQRILRIYDLLETDHHIQSLENISRRILLQQYST